MSMPAPVPAVSPAAPAPGAAPLLEVRVLLAHVLRADVHRLDVADRGKAAECVVETGGRNAQREGCLAHLLRAQRKWMLYPTAHLLLADIALLAGDHETAIAAAGSAARAFHRVGREQSAALARLTLLRARYAAGIPVQAGRARTLADALAEAGHVSPSVEAGILALRAR